jgi:predicted ATPase
MALVFDQLTHLLFAAGQLTAARDAAITWVGRDALNEMAYRRLIELHVAAGDRSAALLAYDACRSTVRQAFDAEPEAATESLVARIRDATRMSSPARSADYTRPAMPLTLEGPLVGRADEYARLVALYQAARRGASQAAVIVGEAGIGKTRLAREFADWAAADGADILRARALEIGGRLPYQPLVQALRVRLERENAP